MLEARQRKEPEMPYRTPSEQAVDDVVGQIEEARERADDAEAALDEARTRWDNTRGYVADLLGQAEADVATAHRLHGADSQDWAEHYGREVGLRAVASFMDGQHDGTVTRG